MATLWMNFEIALIDCPKRRRRLNQGPRRGSHAGVVSLPAHSKFTS